MCMCRSSNIHCVSWMVLASSLPYDNIKCNSQFAFLKLLRVERVWFPVGRADDVAAATTSCSCNAHTQGRGRRTGKIRLWQV